MSIDIGSAKFQSVISTMLSDQGSDLTKTRAIAECIQKMSDFYIANPGQPTPWKQPWARVAQLAYYLPLNFLRAEKIYQELGRLKFLNNIENVMDFGAGLGAGSLHLASDPSKTIQFIENNLEAQQLHRQVLDGLGLKGDWTWYDRFDRKQPLAKSLGVFSYSMTEVQDFPDWALGFDRLLLIEPSTQTEGRKLMALRTKLMDSGLNIWAPCTHSQSCPLLTESKTDWCHDRRLTDLPDWMLAIEAHLPFKNRSLTFSYLAASKSKPLATTNLARLVGDQLDEKGKSRVLICRGPTREYISWLHREKLEVEFSRGDIVEISPLWKKLGNELRISLSDRSSK